MANRGQTEGRGMSKRHQAAVPPKPVPAVIIEQPIAKIEHVEEHRRCPICWDRCKGIGLVYSTQGRTRYYKCKKTQSDLPPCGHTWTATVQIVRVEHRTVELDGR